MKKYISIMLVILPAVCVADTVWDSGYHEITEGQTYGEIWMHNDATADMWGGDVSQLGALGTSKFNMYDGTMYYLIGRYGSVIDIYGGSITNSLGLAENALANIYAYDVIYHYDSGYNDRGWMEGKYIRNDQHFSFGFAEHDNSHISIVPEPATLFLLSIGGILMRIKK